MKLLVTGTTGGVGAAVKSAALARSYEVFEINRADWVCLRDKIGSWVAAGHRFDAVVFATGTCPVRPVALTSDELLAETIEVNCGLFHRLMRTLLEERAIAEEGLKAIAVSSISATEGWPGGAVYCASKGALSALCRAMNAELARKRISVTAVEPRHIRTKMFLDLAGKMGAPAEGAESPDDFAREILALLD